MAALLDVRTHDGSRQFGELPLRADWYEVRDHALRLPGATLTAFVCDDVTEAWIDFAYDSHDFSINDQFGEFWFSVADPACSEALLRFVLDHFEKLPHQRPPPAAP